MKIFAIKTSLILGLAISMLSVTQSKAEGLFGRKKKSETPINADLFPEATQPRHLTSSSPSAPSESTIFKDGQPQQVKETSYVIKDGMKIEKTEKKSSGLFGRKKSEERETPKPSPSGEVPSFDLATQPPQTEASAPSRKTAPVSVTEPAPIATAPALPTGKKERKFGLPNLTVPSLPKFRKEDAPIDTSRAEVLVNNGNGTLVPSGTVTTGDYKVKPQTEPVTKPGPVTPPKTEGGSIVYNSWDDVSARKISAADQIVGEMKSQEAAHRRKIEEARRLHEEQIKKAEADARIRAIMQGAMVPPQGGI